MGLKTYIIKAFPDTKLSEYCIKRKIKYTYYMRLFESKYPNTRLIFPHIPSHIKKVAQHTTTYSEAGVDSFVYNTFFKGKRDGIFCDVGANHPVYINNTYMFEQMGWTGIAFDPLPEIQPLWKKHRRAKFFPFAISTEQKALQFTPVQEANASSYITETVKDEVFASNTSRPQITVQAVALQNILDMENITHIDYMSMDIEGHELQALQGIDFNKVRIQVLSIENNSNMNGVDRMVGDDTLRRFMKEKGYTFHTRIMEGDDIFVHQDFISNIGQ